MPSLGRDFFERDPAEVAVDLLGCRLVRRSAAGVSAGIIVETEAYLHEVDPACHSYRKRTARNASMFGPPGHAYVYAIHSRWCFNTVTEPAGVASAVLIRAVEPTEGIASMRERRGKDRTLDLCRGPAKLCEALGIGKEQDGHDLTKGRSLFIEERTAPWTADIRRSERIGISQGKEMLLRFFVAESPFVSGRRSMPSVPLSDG